MLPFAFPDPAAEVKARQRRVLVRAAPRARRLAAIDVGVAHVLGPAASRYHQNASRIISLSIDAIRTAFRISDNIAIIVTVPPAPLSVAMVVPGNSVAVAVEDDHRLMVDASRHAVAVQCVRIMAAVADAFSVPIHDVARAPACSPDRPCATPDHPGGKNISSVILYCK